MQDTIERSILLSAPQARVWRAVSDHKEFGQWFRVETSGPFAPNAVIACRCLYPGMEHLTWEMRIREVAPERLFSFDWPAYYGEAFEGDASNDPWLHVAFHIAPEGAGTKLTIIESGFAALPPDRAPTAFRLNEGGWDEQIKNVSAHVGG